MTTQQIQEDAQVLLTPELMAGLIAKKCEDDDDFRAEFEKNPKHILEELSGEKIPDDLEVVVCHNEDNVWHIPVPDYKELANIDMKKLSEEELKLLSGGEILVKTGTSTVLAFAIVLSIIGAGVVGGLVAGGGILAGAIVPSVLSRRRRIAEGQAAQAAADAEGSES